MNLIDVLELGYPTAKQEKYINAVIETGSQRKAANKLNVSKSTIQVAVDRVTKKAEQYKNAPEYHRAHAVPEPFFAEKLSTCYNKDGDVSMQWVKSSKTKEDQANAIQLWLDSVVDELPTYPPTVYVNDTAIADLLILYPLGDPHIGMAAYVNETGEEWGLAKAKTTFLGVFDRLIQSTPKDTPCVIVNLGDYFHADNVAGVTTRSGHPLDMDSNYISMIDCGMEIMLYMINKALLHHSEVRIINAIGNHDDTGSMFLQVALKHMYQNEPRVLIDVTANPYNFIHFGQNLYGVHHGHTTKADKLPLVMATDKPIEWGSTKYRTWLCGHIHHDTKKEYTGCTVETFRTISSKDSYATWGGYRSLQDSKAIVVHRDFGEIERHTININQLCNRE